MKHRDSMFWITTSLKNDGCLEAPPFRCPDAYRDGQVGHHFDDRVRRGLMKSHFAFHRGASAPTIAIAMYGTDPQFDSLHPLTVS